MSVIRVGSTTKYAEGWGAVFGKAPAGTKKSAKKTRAAKKGAKKSAAKGSRRK